MDQQLFLRQNGDRVSIEQIASIIANRIISDPSAHYVVTVGTDSQNFSKTKVVEVVALHRVGSGGIFFYRTEYIRRIGNLRQKIHEETQRSISIADELFGDVELALMEGGLDINALGLHFQIHCDVGRTGDTRMLVQEIVGWVQSLGYDCAIKPDSYAASSVADALSK